MKNRKTPLLFLLGGCSYVLLELLWRRRSHGSMFLAGGTCFVLLGKLEKRISSVALRAALGSLTITSVELFTGLLANRKHTVWDYRHLPMNYRGQICLPFCLLWMPLSLCAMPLYRIAEGFLTKSSTETTGDPLPF